jgi:ribosomal protein L16/L10AE
VKQNKKDMTTTISTQDKVRNYQGQNSFILNLKQAQQRWGQLTEKQIIAADKCLNSEVKKIDMENLPEDMKRIVDYKGENPFVKDINTKFTKYGTLTSKQIEAAVKQIQKEEDKEKTIRMNWPTIGETIKLGRKIGSQLKEKYGLQFNPILIDITSLKAVSPKAVLFTGKMTVKRGKVCTSCMKTLTDEFSMLTNMGKICAGHMGVEYITDASQAGRFREEYLKRVEEIGEMEFWVPKSQIKKWEGVTEAIMRTI